MRQTHMSFPPLLLLILLWSIVAGCTSSPPVDPVAVLPPALTDGKVVGIGGTVPDRDGISGGTVPYENREPGDEWDGEVFDEPVPKGLFRRVIYVVEGDTVKSVLLIDGRDMGFKRVELENAVRTMCAAYGNSVWFGTPLTDHSPDRIDTMLVWDLGNNARAELRYWRFASNPFDSWKCELSLMPSPATDTLPRREIDCFQR